MRGDRKRSPSLESLEAKRLLTTIHPGHVSARTPSPLKLDGTLKGASSSIDVVYGPTTTVSESFSGRVRAMGAVKATVSDQVDASGHLLGGGIVLQNARGSVRVAFAPGDVVSSGSSGSVKTQVVDYRVGSGSGAFAHATGAGQFTLIETSNLSSELILKAS